MIEPSERKVRNAHIAGLFFGYSQASRMIFLGVVFWVGSVVIRKWGYNPSDVFIAINIIFSAAMGSGVALSNIPSISKAKQSAS